MCDGLERGRIFYLLYRFLRSHIFSLKIRKNVGVNAVKLRHFSDSCHRLVRSPGVDSPSESLSPASLGASQWFQLARRHGCSLSPSIANETQEYQKIFCNMLVQRCCATCVSPAVNLYSLLQTFSSSAIYHCNSIHTTMQVHLTHVFARYTCKHVIYIHKYIQQST